MDIKSFFNEYGEIAVALSGGVDSSVLLFLANKYAKRVKAYCVKSQFQPQFEIEDALSIAKTVGAEAEVIELDVLSEREIVKNPKNRCYYCKKRIFGEICNAARRDGFLYIADGTNASDDTEERAGFKAINELGVLSPLKSCGYTKEKIRALARENNISVYDKPSYACLATRIPVDTEITAELLEKTENAENALISLGFKNFRVRYDDGGARRELGKNELWLYGCMKDNVDEILLDYYDFIYPEIKERADE